ncbi:hypothetical protein F0267_00275 [Vibrio coralliilyticus]|uniref:Uncharacterized protein n=1 Tax=Vibrio coralliilyticus TaxID=190893 RepID=A0AAN0SHS8_9VIBR|nr:hypothetical protein [Vibrio coralliilyticus]AIW22555.1 hypothetical protein IX92_26190 [Vibrio coralliilyticus]NOH36654.1 hypothetical protein [Vibrio coralliilyticus]PAW00424.1 hypothetical protein CKJ79_26830 [Vibrio coralliilyticus]
MTISKTSLLIFVGTLITTQSVYAFNSQLLNRVNETADLVCGRVINKGTYQESALDVTIEGLTPEMVEHLKSDFSLPELSIENGKAVIKRGTANGMKQRDAMNNNMEVRRCRQAVVQFMIRNQG